MTFKERIGVLETYDRARTGPRVDETEWDQKLTYQTAHKLKEKYKLQFDRTKIIPTDTDMIDHLFQAGLEMRLSRCSKGLIGPLKYALRTNVYPAPCGHLAVHDKALGV